MFSFLWFVLRIPSWGLCRSFWGAHFLSPCQAFPAAFLSSVPPVFQFSWGDLTNSVFFATALSSSYRAAWSLFWFLYRGPALLSLSCWFMPCTYRIDLFAWAPSFLFPKGSSGFTCSVCWFLRCIFNAKCTFIGTFVRKFPTLLRYVPNLWTWVNFPTHQF